MNSQPASSSVEQTPSLVRVASDELLLLGARLHDDVALGVLYDRYGAEAYAAALGMLRESDAAEAAMQDAFLRIWRGVEIYDVSFGTTHDWLIGIARGRALNALVRLEPFGGVPEQVMSLDDTGLLAPAEPVSGARDRLLARARAEGGGARAAEAPTVLIPAAELGSEVEPVTESAPGLEAEPATESAPGLDAESATDVMPTLLEAEPATESAPTLDVEPITEPAHALDVEPATESAPTLEAEPASDADLASEAPTLTGLPILGPLAANGQYMDAPKEAVTREAVPVIGEVVDAEAVTQELVTRSDETDQPDASGQSDVTNQPDVPGQSDVTDQPDVPGQSDVTDEPDVTDQEEPAPASRKLAELEPSEALAAALAPIPPRRPQPRRAAPEAPRKRGVKLASIGWGAALLFVVASGLSVAAWSATGPHLSPDLNVLSRLPGGRIVVLRGTGTPTASARLHSVDSGRRAELSVDGLPPLPGGRVYQVWLTEPGQPARTAGSFLVNRRGDAVIPVSLGGPVERLQAIAVTQEPAPGTTAPTGLRMLEGAP
jgi:RNA polymerase sigma-70 factor, ECF subfamily